MRDIASPPHKSKAPSFPPTLGERFPELRELRDRLLAPTVAFDDLPSDWGRLLLNLSDDVPAWSRSDALRVQLRAFSADLVDA